MTCSWIIRALSLAVAGAVVAGCAAGPGIEGGIVGTGNRPDCERAKKAGAPAPEGCPRQPTR